jgi:hypothetical protein
VQIERDVVLAQLMHAELRPSSTDPYKTDKLPDSGEQAVVVAPDDTQPVVVQHRRRSGAGRVPLAVEQERNREGSRLGVVIATSLVALAGALIAVVALSILSGYAARGASPTHTALPAPTALAVVESPLPSPEPPTPEPPTPEPPTPEPPTPELPTPEPTAFVLPTPQPIAVASPVVVVPQQNGDTTTVLFEDTAWQGGFRSSSGSYGGRTATWIYGTATRYNSMRALFDTPGQPRGTATLSVEGMDSEDRLKTQISISVNGVEIYRGPNPLPDDDQPLESGTWATYTWSFDAALLTSGRNEIRISNLDEGAFSRPPFFMLDYAQLSYQ